MRLTEKTVTSTMKPRNQPPRGLWENEWIELTTPDRVRNVPKIERPNARATSTMFQTFSIPRFSWIITECRNAVAASHGMSAAFSTGSHA